MYRCALIPAAGRGLRLDRPGTPKPLVDVGGEPMIVRLLKQLERAGVERAVVVVGFQADTIARTLAGRPDLGIALTVLENPAWEESMAGSLLVAREQFHEPFLLAMADHVFDEPLVSAMAGAPVRPGEVVMLADDRIDRVFCLDMAVKVQTREGRVVAVGRGLRTFDAVDAGLFAATPALFDALARAETEAPGSELTCGVKRLAAEGRVSTVIARDGDWSDVDTPADLVHAEMRLRRAWRATRVQRPQAPQPQLEGSLLACDGRAETRVVVGRGFLEDPSRIPLIPESSAGSPIFVFTDETVNRLYAERFAAELRRLGYLVHALVLPVGEESKSLANYVYLVERVLARGVDERSVFISVGGGVVCNVCGFIASTLYRGLDLVHLPTTLMAQDDAAISHKQGINGQRGKNLIGTYFAPRLVAVDILALQTLSDGLISDGLAEAAKHALGQDAAYAAMLLDHEGGLRDLDFLEAVVRRNVELKCAIAKNDPKEHCEGMVLQYGHTVGHAVEHLSGYRLSHGQSVAVGMMVAARVARMMGACGDGLVRVHERMLRRLGLPVCMPRSIRAEDVLLALKYNKKFLTEGTRMALLSEVGKLWSVDNEHAIPVSDHVIAEAVEAAKEELPCAGTEPWSRARLAA